MTKNVLYDNFKRKGQWIDENESPELTHIVEFYRRKVSLWVWWNHRSIIYFGFLICKTDILQHPSGDAGEESKVIMYILLMQSQ